MGPWALGHAQGHIVLGDGLPAARVHMAQLHQLGHHQFLQFLGLETQVFQALVGGVAAMDQLHAFFDMVHGVLPAAQAGLEKGFHLLRALLQKLAAGTEHIVVEVDPVFARFDQAIGHLLLP